MRPHTTWPLLLLLSLLTHPTPTHAFYPPSLSPTHPRLRPPTTTKHPFTTSVTWCNRRTTMRPPISSSPSSGSGNGASFSWEGFYGKLISQVEDDGYTQSNSKLKRLLRPLLAMMRWRQPGTLIVIRHGESTLNYNRTFTGWIDADLNERGIRETEHAARLLLERGYEVDVTYTSRLKRAIRSSWVLMRELNQIYRPVYKSWRLNERMYGAFEGLSKPGLAAELGESVVQSYRLGLSARPPPMTPDHPFWHGKEKKYRDLDPSEIPITESLQDTMERTLPLWYSRILPDLQAGRTVLICAHANSLRGIVKHIDSLTPEQIQTVAIPNGIPLVYKFDRYMRPIKQEGAVAPISGEFLEKKGLLRAALEKEAELARNVPGYRSNFGPVLDPRVRGLLKLSEDRKLYVDPDAPRPTVTTALRGRVGSVAASAAMNSANNRGRNVSEAGRDKGLFDDHDASGIMTPEPVGGGVGSSLRRGTNVTRAVGVLTGREKLRRKQPVLEKTEGETKDPLLVIIRHGKTEYNKLGVFTGWEDAPLSNDGREEARQAGKLLKRHGFEFDVVYTSWLSRAIETAWLVLDELDSLWLPLIKSWRLNERMYGALTGLSKKMIAQRHGEAKFKQWRRSYATRPPGVSSFSSHYPGNDDRYVKYATDLRYSFSESLMRSISHFRWELHRKFPKTESLKDCMSRTIPYYTDTIVPQSIARGQTVLIASSENAIRGLLMHLCDIAPDRISDVEIPTGLPLVYNIKKRCIQLLETGEEDPEDPIGHLNFGSSPELLFKPCTDEDIELDDCFIGPEGKTYAWDPLIRLR